MKLKDFNLKGAVIAGVMFWFLAMLLGATDIVPVITDDALQALGLFLGVMYGGFEL